MAHLFIVAALGLAAWTVLAFLLGPLIGRRLRHNTTTPRGTR